jgi:hypothetical protein
MTKNCKSSFGKLAPETVERSADVICLVNSEMRITYCNPAWDRFALENGGENAIAAKVVGTELLRVVPDSLRDFYKGMFQRCSEQHFTFDFDYECSSAEMFRLFHMDVLPLNRSGDLALINSVKVECPHGVERPAVDSEKIYISREGIITMCSHCRRSRRQDASGVWDWVPSFLQTREWQVSHGVCPVCFSYFYSTFYSIAGLGQERKKE